MAQNLPFDLNEPIDDSNWPFDLNWADVRNLVTLDGPESGDILICQLCEVHLALGSHLTWMDEPDSEDPYAVVQKMHNIKLRGATYTTGSQVKIKVCCTNCGMRLGSRVVSVDGRDEWDLTEKFIVSTRRFLVRTLDTKVPLVSDPNIRIVKFNRSQGTFFNCGLCTTHIALPTDLTNSTGTPYTDEERGHFKCASNVYTGMNTVKNNITGARLYCSVCDKKLGWKILNDSAQYRYVLKKKHVGNFMWD